MDKQIEFPKFLQHLKEAGIEANGLQLLEKLQPSWDAFPPETRISVLSRCGIEVSSAEGVVLQLGKRAGAPKTLDNVFVIVKVPDANVIGTPTPAAAAPAPAPAPAAKTEPAKPKDAAAAPEKPKGLLARLRSKEEPTVEATGAPGRPITEIPAILDPLVESVEVYAVQDPYAFIRILYDKGTHEYIYEVIEPALDEREKNILAFIEDTLVDVVEIGLSALTEKEAASLLRKHVDEVIYDYSIALDPLSKEKLLYYILRDFLGFGFLDPAMRDELIEDVSCDGPVIPLFMYHRKYESVRSNIVWPTHDALDGYVIRMAQRSGKHISIAEPLLDATLPDGSRLNATLGEEVTTKGSTFTIRKFREDPFTITDLIRFGTMSPDILAYWWMAVQNGASAIYAGGTASGKTTGLNAILLFIPPQMKIVSIEDTREINLPHQNWIAGVTRSGFGPRDDKGRQAGEIDMFTLLKAALRQRPEYIMVGEVRGAEAYALFQAMATGHSAYGTMHADSVESVIHRLESEPISIPRSLLESLDIVSIQIQTRIGDKRVRRTKELVEVVGLDPHTREILTNEVFNWNPARDKFEFSGVSYVLERIQLERNMSEADMRKELDDRKLVIDWLVRKNIRDRDSVGSIIVMYYKEKDQLMELVRNNGDYVKPERRGVAHPPSLKVEPTDAKPGKPDPAKPGQPPAPPAKPEAKPPPVSPTPSDAKLEAPKTEAAAPAPATEPKPGVRPVERPQPNDAKSAPKGN